MRFIKLGEIADFVNGRAFKPVEWGKSGLPIVRIQNLNNPNSSFNFFNGSYSERHLIDTSDVLLSWSGTPGTSFGCFTWNGGKALLNQHIFRVDLDSSIIQKEYFVRCVNANLYQLIDNAHGGVGLQHITKKRLIELQIPVPPLSIQRKIAAALDKADSIRKRSQIILSKYDQLAQSVFLEMFGDPVKNEKGWEVGKTIDKSTSIVPGRDKPKSFTGNTPWVTTDDLNHLSYTLNSRKEIGLSGDEISLVKAKVIPPRSVIMTCVGDLGVVTVNADEIVINQQLHAFLCQEDLNPIFLMFQLSFRKDYFYKMATSTTVPYLNKTKCNSTPSIFPPVSLQNNFASVFEQIEKQKAQTQLEVNRAEELYQSLLQRAFTGELFPETSLKELTHT